VGLSPATERVLIVDEDPDVLDLLSRQVLEPLGYEVATANEAGIAIQQAVSFSPDLIVASLMLPGLSGKDLLVALRSQGLDVPVLVTAEEGQEADAIQAFRLGARDYMVKPLREAEVLAAIERALKEVRLSHETKQLAAELADSHRQLEQRVRELTTIYGIGKAVTSTTNQRELFDKLMLSALNVTNADMGWVLLLDEDSGQIHQAWDDGVSSLVMLSAETLSIHGEGLQQFKLARFAKTALIVPIKAREEAIGVLTVAREEAKPFTEPNQRMLEAVGDYASISLINARLFQALTGLGRESPRGAQRIERTDPRAAGEFGRLLPAQTPPGS
jgi:two-component system NtrC family sensor kinase